MMFAIDLPRDSIFHVFDSTARTNTHPTTGLLFHFRHCKTKPIRRAATAANLYLPNLSLHSPASIRIRLIKNANPNSVCRCRRERNVHE